MKALIVAPSWIGDAIMAQPLFMRLRERFPDCHLDAFAPPWVAPVMLRMPEISTVIDNPFGHGQLALKKRWQTAREITQGAYDRAYILPNSLKSALIPALAGIPERIGFTGESRYGLVNRRHRLDKTALPRMVERFAQLGEPPGASVSRPVPPPRLRSTSETQRETLSALGLAFPANTVAFCPGAEYGPAKRWPVHHFAALAQALQKVGYSVALFGSQKDRPLAEAIGQAAPGCLNLCGATTLTQAIDLLALSKLVVCNDSGLMHVAAAVDRPIVALYGSSSPGFTPPLSNRAQILSRNLDCAPCFKRTCPLGHFDCLEGLSPEQVLVACQKALHENTAP